MSLRSGFQSFASNIRQWGLRTGTNVRIDYNKARQIANTVQPHLQKTTRFIEGVNTGLQRTQVLTSGDREKVDTWTRKLRNFSDNYDKTLNKWERIHDIAVE